MMGRWLSRWWRRIAWVALMVLLAFAVFMVWLSVQRYDRRRYVGMTVESSDVRTYTESRYACHIGEGWLDLHWSFDLNDKQYVQSMQDKGWKPNWPPAGITNRDFRWGYGGRHSSAIGAYSGPPLEYHPWTRFGYFRGQTITIRHGEEEISREWSAPGVVEWTARNWRDSRNASGDPICVSYARHVGIACWIPCALLLVIAWPAIRTIGVSAWKLAVRWHRPGVCPGCGYDLRATPERCPECGRVMTVQQNRSG